MRPLLPHLFLALLTSLACARGQLPAPAAVPAAAAPPTRAEAAPAPQGVVAPLALGALQMQAPACPAGAPATHTTFCEAARRALRHAFEDDSEEDAALLSLLNALEVNPALEPLREAWHSPLRNALARAHTLAQCGAPLRLLRHAVLDAYLDPRIGLYRGVDTSACRAAFVQLSQQGSGWQDLVVTLEPLGTYPLSTFRRFCLDSRTLPGSPP